MVKSPAFLKAFKRTHISEGGFTEDPNDRGNWTSGQVGLGELKGTMCGISAMSYPELDIAKLSSKDVEAIYWQDWWVNLEMEQWHPAVAAQLFDAAVNHGMHNTTRMLQRAAGVIDDGIIGDQTRAAVRRLSLEDVLMLFLAERLEFMANIKTFNLYGRGWSRRIAQNLRWAAEDTPE